MNRLIWIIGWLFPALLCAQNTQNTAYHIVFIGNSITQGVLLPDPAQQSPPAQAVRWLGEQPGVGKIAYANQGLSGATTVDFLPASETLFPKVKQAAEQLTQQNPHATLLFSMMLGTNDSAIKGPNGSPVSPQQYLTNVKVIIDELLRSFPRARFVLHRPVWYSPNTYNGSMYLREGLQRLDLYFAQLQKLVDQYRQQLPGQVYMGDTDAYDYFKANHPTDVIPEQGNAGTFYLHPNAKGAEALGKFWGTAIYRIIGK